MHNFLGSCTVKKNKNFEMRIYEMLGVKIFRDMAFFLRDIISYPLFRLVGVPKEKIDEELYHSRNNYNLGKIKSIEDVESFKSMLWLNSSIHIIAILAIFINGFAVGEIFWLILNLYCLMLQRYNFIRINRFIKKFRPKYEKEKSAIREELIEEDSKLLDHSYKLVNKKGKVENISFEDYLKTASLEDLKKCREYFNYISKVTKYKIHIESEFPIYLDNNKKLILELNQGSTSDFI